MSALSYTQDARRHRHRLRSSLPRVGASSVSARAEQFDPALSRLESRLLAQIATGMSEILNNPNIKSEMKDKLIQKQLQMLENGLAAVGGSSRLVPM